MSEILCECKHRRPIYQGFCVDCGQKLPPDPTPSQALPPEPGKLEEEAKRWFQTINVPWDHPEDLAVSAYLAGARSRDALLASQGERIKEQEAKCLRYSEELNRESVPSLRAALEQVKAERDELKRLHDIEAVRVDITARDALKARIASLEEGLRDLSNCWEHIPSLDCSARGYADRLQADRDSRVRAFVGARFRARALLAAGEKAGGGNGNQA